MKTMMALLCSLISTAVIAQQNNRGLVFNKELRILIGTWEGKTVYTDPKQNNTQVTLQTKLKVSDLKDSLRLYFEYGWPDGRTTSDTTDLCIYDKKDSLSFDHELFEIVSTGRKGASMIVVGERQGFDNRLVADLRRVLTFAPGSLNIQKESRYMENEFFFIRSRCTLIKTGQ